MVVKPTIRKKTVRKTPVVDLVYEPSIFDLNSLYETPEKRQAAAAALTIMVKAHGWQVIKSVIDLWIKKLDNQFFNTPIDEKSELLRRERQYLVMLSNLPKDLSESFLKEDSGETSLDPY